jgi:lauroyl/myristoyl acyltransferase
MSVFHELLFALEWLALKNRSRDQLLADGQALHIADEDVLRWASKQKSVILATLHMGSYPTSLARLLHAHFQGWKIIIVKSKAITGDERDALNKLSLLGIRVEYLFLESQETFLDLVRSVKRGAVLITLVDLPHLYGRSCEVELLWQPAEIAIGVIDLSYICRAPIVLFKTASGVFGDEICIHSVLQPTATDAGARKLAADKIATFITAAVVENPAQWHMWDRLTEYAVPSCFA